MAELTQIKNGSEAPVESSAWANHDDQQRDTPCAPEIHWPARLDSGPLESNDVHIWGFSLGVDEAAYDDLWGFLTADEKDRAARFRFDRHRRRYIAGRGVLRQVVGAYTGVEPGELRFTYGEHGKPLLTAMKGQPNLHFNLAHSKDLALLAISRLPDLGVDVEQIRWLDDFEELVARFFSPRESAAFRQLPEEIRAEAFFNLWTRKEAWLKAIGEGIGYSLNRVEVSFIPTQPAQLLALPENRQKVAEWSLRALSPATGFAGALAVKAKNPRISSWQWRTEPSTQTAHSGELASTPPRP